MKKNGFTLIELLTVIVILGIIITLAVPKMMLITNNKKQTLYEDNINELKRLASTYIIDYPEVLRENPVSIPISVLCSGGYIECPIIDPRDSSEITGNIVVNEVNGTYIYFYNNGILKSVEIIINTNDGEVVENQNGTYTQGQFITLNEPIKENYTFAGWEKVSGECVLSGNDLVIGAEDATIKALWIPTSYEITYTLDGGSASNPSSYNVESSPIILADPTKPGYTFTGWTGSNGSTKQTTVTISTGSAGNKSYTANWTPIPYDITYTLNGGDASNPISYNVESNITLTNPTKPGYTFTGWTGSNGSTKQTTVTISTGSTGPKSYIANWTPTPYAITYTLNGGSATNPSSYNVESNITLANPTKPGYTFTGWTGSNGSTKQTTVTISTGSIGPKSYTANWTSIPYDITYTLNGGDASNPTSYNVESSSITLANPTKPNYTFTGWTGSNGSTKQTTVTISTGSTGNKSYTANWTPTPYGITYTLNGGSATNPSSYNVESNITLTNPTKPNYTFDGWTGSNGSTKQTTVTISTGSTGPKSYTANWTPTPYGITYTLNGGSATNPTSYNVESSSITLTNPTKPGYTFDGWTGSNGPTKQTSVTISRGSTGPKSYTANWTALTYTITYNCNGGQGSTASTTWTYGTTTILRANGCYKITAGSSGMVYYLKGWAKTSTATTVLFTDKQNITNSAQITSNTTLYAVWGTLFTITGNYEVINDGTYNWRLKIKGAAGSTYGTASITLNNKTNIDIFAVGGGGGGSKSGYASGGGGGYTNTYEAIEIGSGTYSIVVGKGGSMNNIGSQTYAFNTNYKADGGKPGVAGKGGDGGSGGGYWRTRGASYGASVSGSGQGNTTCEFEGGSISACNTNVTAYSGGGSGQDYTSGSVAGGGGAGGSPDNGYGVAGTANTGGGGGAGYNGGGAGGSGIVVIRNAR